MQIAGQHVLVVGFGVTGQALTRFLSRRGARVTVTDTADEHRMSQHLDTLRSLGVKAEWGEHRTDAFLQTDLILLSPGVDQRIAPLRQARERGIPVWGEIELAARFIAEPIVAVTGTNGKTTTTALLGKMLENSGIQVFVGGNIGDPLIGYVDREEKARVIVAEVSSFQLDTIETFRPEVGLLLNISEDHLDRYLDFDAYVRAKGRLFENQTAAQVAVLNGSDRRVRSLVPDIRSRKLFFTGRRAPERGATIHPARIALAIDPPGVADLDLTDFQLPGR
ncbi:MAG: UDP-N-acetylmuramoyl-L-alanine--D-glutamate ligase, partial [Desulfobacterales bacterium]|nr:UDP-N-acetylmuramoyl-L-alanine--D-glutamate ligase [Desulfobacterales bacterium]